MPRVDLRKKAAQYYSKIVYAGNKYKQNDSDKQLIGIQDAVLFWASTSGIDNSVDDAGNSGLHKTIFDTTTRADCAQIKLLNDSEVTKYVVAAAIKAKPVIRLSGEQGFVHDSFVDYQDIFYAGENLFEFGNNYVVTKDQLEKLADYYAKALGVNIGADAVLPRTTVPKNKHLYTVTIPGRCWWYEPGEWYLLQIGGAGQREYIDSVVECYSVQVEVDAGGLGSTSVSFREVEQNWVKDSNALARFLATGDPKWKPNNFGRVVVAARDYMGVADYYCDGTADQVEIQAAIDHLAGTGGGLVQLTEGQYSITASINLADLILLRGAGPKTIIEKNCNDHGIEFVGTSVDYVENAEVSNMAITADNADTNASKNLIHLDYAKNCLIYNCFIHNSYADGIHIEITETISIIKNTIYGNANYGMSGYGASINVIVSENNIYENLKHGIYLYNAAFGTISNNYCHDNGYCGIELSNATNFNLLNNRTYNNRSNRLVYRGTNQNVYTMTDVGSIYIGGNAVNNMIMGNRGKDNDTWVDDGDCEQATPPVAYLEATNTLTNCTYARSNVQKWAGTYSYRLTKTIAAGTAATGYITDNANTNDLHGLFAGQEYRFGVWVYIPAGGMLGSELSLVIRDYIAAWEETAVACANTYDAWQYVEVTKTLRAGSGGATFGFSIAAAAANTETAYTDNLRLTPMGTGNLNNQNFYGGGTGTYSGL